MWFTPRTANVFLLLLLFPPQLRLTYDGYISRSPRESRAPAPAGFHPTPYSKFRQIG